MHLYSFKHLHKGYEYIIDFRLLDPDQEQFCVIVGIWPHFTGIQVPFYYSRSGEPSQSKDSDENFHSGLYQAIMAFQPLE